MTEDLRSSAPTKSKIIMGVDDTPENLQFLKRAIEAGGYTFFPATNGHECLTMLSRVTPKLLLLDIEMEPIDGFETCRRVRRMTGFEQLPIAFLTARKTAEDVESGLAAGGNDFIVKPYSIPKLRERVEYWMTHRPRPAA
jgi:CheY-like chemotaxis protein